MAKRNLKEDVLTSILGGINYDVSPLAMALDETPSVQDMMPAVSLSSIETRRGFVRHNSGAITGLNHVTGLASWLLQGAVPSEQFCALSGGKFWESVSGVWTDRTGSLSLSNATTNLMSWDVLNNTLIVCTLFRDQPFSWAGARVNAVAVTGSPPFGNLCIVFNRRAFIFNTTSNPLLGYYSALDNINSWNTGTDFLNFDEGSGASITGCVRRSNDQMIVFKEKSIHVVERTGTIPPFYRYLLRDGIGCAGHFTIATLPNGDIIWADVDDFYMLSGNTIKSITVHPKTGQTRLRSFFQTILDTSRLKYASAVYYRPRDVYRFFFTRQQGSVNDRHIDYHVKTQGWWPGTLSGTIATTRLVSGTEQLVAGVSGGFVNRQDFTDSDNGSAIPWNWSTAWRHLGVPNIRKKYDSFFAYIDKKSNYNIQADVFLDYLGSSTITNQSLDSGTISGAQWDVSNWDSANWADENISLEHYLPINRLGKAVRVNIRHNTANEPGRINSAGFYTRILELTARTQ